MATYRATYSGRPNGPLISFRPAYTHLHFSFCTTSHMQFVWEPTITAAIISELRFSLARISHFRTNNAGCRHKWHWLPWADTFHACHGVITLPVIPPKTTHPLATSSAQAIYSQHLLPLSVLPHHCWPMQLPSARQIDRLTVSQSVSQSVRHSVSQIFHLSIEFPAPQFPIPLPICDNEQNKAQTLLS